MQAKQPHITVGDNRVTPQDVAAYHKEIERRVYVQHEREGPGEADDGRGQDRDPQVVGLPLLRNSPQAPLRNSRALSYSVLGTATY